MAAHWEGLRRPQPISVSEWAEKVRRLSIEASAERGHWRNRPFQAEPMDCLTPSSPYQQVVLMVASQTLKTETVLNFLGYIIDRDPGPTLIVEPREIDGRALSKDRINPMLRDTPELAAKLLRKPTRGMSVRGMNDEKPRSGNIGNSALHIKFAGGHVSIAGSHSPAGLAMRPIRYLMLDEVDRYPSSAGQEGDPVLLAMRRTDEFAWNKKVLLCSTPTIEGWSRIQRAYMESDQRRPLVPCPMCGEYQELEFGRLEFGKDPKSAAYRCLYCNQLIPHFRKGWMLSQGKWVITNPKSDVAGFWLSQLYSARRSWVDIAAEWLVAHKAPDTLRVFKNTVLAETWKESSETPDAKRLYERAEPYPLYVIPKGGLMLTAGVDVQENRLEVIVLAWGKDKQSWMVDYQVIEGPVRQFAPITLADGSKRPSVWQRLQELLANKYIYEPTGKELGIKMLAIDCGWATQEVYHWARQVGPMQVMLVRGSETKSNVREGVILGVPKKVDVSYGGRMVYKGTRFWPINVNHAKNHFHSCLKLEKPTIESGDPYPPFYCHFPQMNLEFFQQLVAEHLEQHVDRKGYRRPVWTKHGANEALDAWVYAYAAAIRVDMLRWTAKDWRKLEAALEIKSSPAAEEPAFEPQVSSEPAAASTQPAVPPATRLTPQSREVRRSYAPSWNKSGW